MSSTPHAGLPTQGFFCQQDKPARGEAIGRILIKLFVYLLPTGICYVPLQGARALLRDRGCMLLTGWFPRQADLALPSNKMLFSYPPLFRLGWSLLNTGQRLTK